MSHMCIKHSLSVLKKAMYNCKQWAWWLKRPFNWFVYWKSMEREWKQNRFLPAAKWSGDDFLPAVSLELTFCVVTSFFTLFKSPFLHASNNSRPGSFWEGEFCSSIERRLVAIFNFNSRRATSFSVKIGVVLLVYIFWFSSQYAKHLCDRKF